MNSPEHYPRVRIRGTLHCRSALHIGDGEMKLFAERCERSQEQEGLYNSVCLDSTGRPYLPASTLRGFLRGIAEYAGKNELIIKLFGDQQQSGALRCYDAYLLDPPAALDWPYWSAQRSTAVQHGVALDPITGTVAAHKLFRHEYVPPGSEFSLELEADNLLASDLSQVLGLLACWDGKAAAAIGKGISKGQGLLEWQLNELQVLDHAALLNWLRSDKSLENYFRGINKKKLPRAARYKALSLKKVSFSLHPQGPFLVNEPGYVQKSSKKSQLAQPQEKHSPDLEYSRLPDGRPLLPASSLRGVLRSRARRILLTLASQRGIPASNACRLVNDLVSQLFGETGQRSPLWISPAEGTAFKQHLQMFNAIDRFTGGVADEKLYQVNAVTGGALNGVIHLEQDQDRQPDGDWWKGLLLLVARDALEGDLSLGWGKARGYGAFTVTLELEDDTVLDSWPSLLAYLQQTQQRELAQSWITALHDHLDACLAQTDCVEESHG